MLVGGVVLARRRLRIDVRWIGKVATFSLMVAIPTVAWGTVGLWPAAAALAIGWPLYAVGIVEYYVAAAVYASDLRSALRIVTARDRPVALSSDRPGGRSGESGRVSERRRHRGVP